MPGYFLKLKYQLGVGLLNCGFHEVEKSLS